MRKILKDNKNNFGDARKAVSKIAILKKWDIDTKNHYIDILKGLCNGSIKAEMPKTKYTDLLAELTKFIMNDRAEKLRGSGISTPNLFISNMKGLVSPEKIMYLDEGEVAPEFFDGESITVPRSKNVRNFIIDDIIRRSYDGLPYERKHDLDNFNKRRIATMLDNIFFRGELSDSQKKSVADSFGARGFRNEAVSNYFTGQEYPEATFTFDKVYRDENGNIIPTGKTMPLDIRFFANTLLGSAGILGTGSFLNYLLPEDQSLIYKKGGGIHIKKKNRGKFTASAKAAGESVLEHAQHVLNDPNATPLQKKRANFARNAAKWHHK